MRSILLRGTAALLLCAALVGCSSGDGSPPGGGINGPAQVDRSNEVGNNSGDETDG